MSKTYGKYKFYTCKSDRAFKEVFMKEENKDLLKALLEKVLNLKIEKIIYLNLEKNVGNIHVKRKHFDLSLKTDKGYIQVEVNAVDEDYVRPRNMAYICNTYSRVTEVGDVYTEDIMVIQINFSYGLDDDKFCRRYKVQDKDNDCYVKNFIIYEINMDLYHKFWDNNDEKAIEENKLFIMLNLGLNDLKKLSSKDKVVRKYMEELDKVNQDPLFQEYMSAEEDNRKIENSRKLQWKREGLEEGRKEGIAEGIAKQKEIIINMYKDDVDIKTISKYTNLSIEEINNIINN